MKHLIIRADGSSRIGTGHLMRTLALAQAWRDVGGTATLITHRSSPPSLTARWDREDIHVERIADEPGSPADVVRTVGVAQDADTVAVVLDGYRFGTDFHDAVRAAGFPLLVIDDLAHLTRYSATWVLNQNLHATEDMYAGRVPATSLLMGPRYALLRRELRNRPPTRTFAAPPIHLLVTMGGADPSNMTAEVIRALASLSSMCGQVLIGPLNSHRASIEGVAREAGFEVVPDPHDVAPLFDWADLAVSAAGSTVLELCARGVPTILVAITDAQMPITDGLVRGGLALPGGSHSNWKPQRLVSQVELLMGETTTRRRMSNAVQELVDARGVERIVALLSDSSISALRPATDADRELIWQWANDPDTRAASFQSDAITWETHCEWFTRQQADPAALLLIGLDSREAPMGFVRFSNIDAEIADISINLAPDHRGLGGGATLIRRACRYLFDQSTLKRIRALVKPANIASQRSFLRAGFSGAGATDVAGAPAIVMIQTRGDLP